MYVAHTVRSRPLLQHHVWVLRGCLHLPGELSLQLYLLRWVRVLVPLSNPVSALGDWHGMCG